MPESCSNCGEPTAPEARITSRRARTVEGTSLRRNCTPVARLSVIRIFSACAWVITVRLGRESAGRKKPLDVFQRQPLR